MASLLAAALFFVGIHFVISGTALRGKIVGLIGEGPFRGVFSLMSLIGIVWLSRAYGQTEYVELWGRPYTLRPFALITMLVAFFAGVSTTMKGLLSSGRFFEWPSRASPNS